MSSARDTVEDIDIEVENIGGIDRTSVGLTPGVTILSGRNATNRTSFLQAIMAGHGSDQVSLKADADAGSVVFTVEGDTYEQHLNRENGTVSTSGTPYLDDAMVADRFAFLLEDNDARRAVERGDDLRDIIMEPVDTEAIQTEIRELEAEKQQLDEQLAELENLEGRLPDLEAERTTLQERIEAKRSELESKEAELEQADASVDEKREAKSELESKLDELHEARSDLEDIRFELETERDTLSSLRDERADLESEYDSLSETSVNDLDRIETRLDELHDRKQAITADLNQLQTIIQFNEEVLDGSDDPLPSGLDGGQVQSDDGTITDKLVDTTDTVTCWTCGSTVEEERIHEMMDEHREFRQRKLGDRRELEDEIDELQSEKETIETKQQRREELERKLEEFDDRIAQTEATITDLENQKKELVGRVTALEEETQELEQEEQSELLDLHKSVTQLEIDLERLVDDLESVDAEIESIEDDLSDRSELEDRREAVKAELEDLRMTVERLEQNAIEEFNSHMEALLEELGFENLERVWLERIEQDVHEGRRTSSKATFDLHVVRETDSGSVYEDSVDHLSESEREVLGLVFALAGYLVHDVHEQVPFMLLDSLEAIDADRIAALVDYFADYADYLVVALLPEDAAALDDKYSKITEI